MKSRPPTRAGRAPGRHVLLYDAGCEFCTAVARWIEKHARVDLAILPLSEAGDFGMLTGLTPAEVEASVHLVEPDGREYHEGEAATRAMRLVRGGRLLAPLDLPGLRLVRDLGYRLVSRYRGLLAPLVRRLP